MAGWVVEFETAVCIPQKKGTLIYSKPAICKGPEPLYRGSASAVCVLQKLMEVQQIQFTFTKGQGRLLEVQKAYFTSYKGTVIVEEVRLALFAFYKGMEGLLKVS